MSRPLHPSDPRALIRSVDEHGRPVASTSQPVCDFCLALNPTWEYPAAPMPIQGHHTIDRSEDEFAACDECHRMIEQKSVGALVERMVTEQRRHLTESGTAALFKPVPIHRRESREILLRFFDARTGPPRPWTP